MSHLAYKLYLMTMPFGSKGGSQDTRREVGELMTTLMSAGGPGAEIYIRSSVQPELT